MSVNNIAALLLLLILVAVPAAAQRDFDSFKTLYSRKYVNAEEEQYRRTVFKTNVDMIKAHNRKANRTYDLGENQFVDFTTDELSSTFYLI